MQKKYIKNTLGFDTNLFVYQDKQMFNYSVDTVLLANFISLSSKTKKVLEIGTNNAALSIFFSVTKRRYEYWCHWNSIRSNWFSIIKC
nr:hypothetical protein [Ureaplasma urealyticum]